MRFWVFYPLGLDRERLDLLWAQVLWQVVHSSDTVMCTQQTELSILKQKTARRCCISSHAAPVQQWVSCFQYTRHFCCLQCIAVYTYWIIDLYCRCKFLVLWVPCLQNLMTAARSALMYRQCKTNLKLRPSYLGNMKHIVLVSLKITLHLCLLWWWSHTYL